MHPIIFILMEEIYVFPFIHAALSRTPNFLTHFAFYIFLLENISKRLLASGSQMSDELLCSLFWIAFNFRGTGFYNVVLGSVLLRSVPLNDPRVPKFVFFTCRPARIRAISPLMVM